MKRVKNPEVSIIIVHYGADKEVFVTLKALDKIRRKTNKVEFLFVDNEEIKKSGKLVKRDYKWIKYLDPVKNLGFGGGRNFAAKFAKGEYLLMLDSDVVIEKKAFSKILSFIKSRKNAGIVSPRLTNISGKFTPSATKELTPLIGVLYLSFVNKYFGTLPPIRHYLLKGWDRKNTRPVEVAQLGAFVIRKSDFEKVGGFDPEMFLYFEENDLAKKIQRLSKKVYLIGEVEVVHLESKGTPKSSERIQNIFKKSRRRYFSKYYGYLNALVVELFCSVNKYSLLFLAILILGSFLRFYKVEQNLIFNGEMGYDYTVIKSYVEQGKLPLLGPRTSHEWFFIGPLFYWMFQVLMPLFEFKVETGAYFFALVCALGIWVCYVVVKKLMDEKVALISSYLMAISPLWVGLARDARFNAFTAILFFPYLWLVNKSIVDNGKSLFWLGLTLGVMFSFFPSPILLIPGALAVLFLYGKKIEQKKYLNAFFGFLIPNTPYLIYNATHGFKIVTDLISWIPYRILGFVGLYPKNNANVSIVSSNFTGLFRFFESSFFNESNISTMLFTFALFLFSVYGFIKHNKIRPLLIVALVSYFGLFLHGNPPSHYYLVIYPIPLILGAYFLNKILNKSFVVGTFILMFISFSSFVFFFSDKWFFVRTDKVSDDINFVPFRLQKEVVMYISKDANGRPFELRRVGPLDHFREDFSLHYRYLLKLEGASVVNGSSLIYTIYEDTGAIPKNLNTKWISNLAITKYEEKN